MATYTLLRNANNSLCREAEKSVYKTCKLRASSSKGKTSDSLDDMDDKEYIRFKRTVR